ncbi:hypothetical protein J6590_067263 [Homalodisca vitripennis]|nr:hypothetical protein J6590_067263 [Homalodisca vitripennis]
MIYSTSSSEGDDDDPAIANEEQKNKATKLRIKCEAEPDKTKQEISIENNTSFVSYSSPKNKLLVKDKAIHEAHHSSKKIGKNDRLSTKDIDNLLATEESQDM